MSRSIHPDNTENLARERERQARAQEGHVDSLHCIACDHPGSHHDAGECWTDGKGRETSAYSVCGCGWYTPRYAATT